jgi:RNA polymerase sigma factor (sigma-70 family)
MTVDTLEKEPNEIAGRTPLGKVVQAERRRLFDFIRRRIRDERDAEDILQDVFYQLVTSYSVTDPIENLTAWLFTVARNKIIDWYRKRRSAALTEQQIEREEEGPLNLEEILFDPQDQPDRAYWRSTVWSELAEALDDLPEEQRQVFVWHELEGRSFKEMAEMTGEPINTLLSRKRYAVLAIRERLQELYDEIEN